MMSEDQVSESWCSVQFPCETTLVSQVPRAAVDERVCDWLSALEPGKWTVAYEPHGQPAGRLQCVDLEPSPQTQTQQPRSLSDASLRDFLRGVYRPTFADKPTGGARLSAPDSLVEPMGGERLSASDSAVVCAAKERASKTRQRRRKVGWAAERLDARAARDALGAAQADVEPARDSASSRPRRDAPGPAAEPPAAVESEAEFLSHAFHHFVAFQPLDFAARAPAQDTGAPGVLASAAVAGMANIRAYFSGMLDEFAHHESLFIQ
ncbi:hypothetical protein LPJ63_003422 [Coemansia sp. RSA 2711]|nr:hypothetical protein LPJ63_003422 [Coemansia sp. RSA 2711]